MIPRRLLYTGSGARMISALFAMSACMVAPPAVNAAGAPCVAPLPSGAVACGDAPSAVIVVVVATLVGAVVATVAVGGAAAAPARSVVVPYRPRSVSATRAA